MSAIGEHIEKHVVQQGGPRVAGREGYEQGMWVLIDFSDVIVHIFEPAQREVFDLEQLWSEAPRVQWNPENPPKTLFEPEPRVAKAASFGAAPRAARRAR